VRSLLSRLRLVVRLLREPSVPVGVKALTALPLVYLAWPIDLLPDLVPVLGQLDDLGVLLLAAEAFLGLCPPELVAHHRRAIDEGRPYAPAGRRGGSQPGGRGNGDVIDAEWRLEDPQGGPGAGPPPVPRPPETRTPGAGPAGPRDR
jgi:uncharacterized membrane protein YkvA (DUF1232 family)